MKNNILYNMTPNFKFDNSKLSQREKASVKKFASEERAPYGNGPIGRDIFSFIYAKENLKLILYEFNEKAVDLEAMIFKFPKSDNTWILLNKRKSLLTQIFAVAHEYYHFKKDIPSGIKGITCDFKSTNTREIKANLFASEFLLPRDAIVDSINNMLIKNESLNELNYLYLIIDLSSRYCIPFDLCHFRIQDEGLYKTKIKKDFFEKQKILFNNLLKDKSSFKELLDNKNIYITDENIKILRTLYFNEFITEVEFINLSKSLNISPKLIENILSLKSQNSDEKDDDNDDDVFDTLRRS